jgi:uncharacterized protein
VIPTDETAAADSLADTLQLADWRRRIGELYVEVRSLLRTDRDAALELWRSTRERLYKEHPQSPVPPDARPGFWARHYADDPSLSFEVAVAPDEPGPGAPASDSAPLAMPALDFATPLSMDLPVSTGGAMATRRIGHVDIPFRDGDRRLGVFWMSGYAGGLFIPFRDATNGGEKYGAGRYLVDAAKSADLGGDPTRGTILLDFNFAFHPSCAFDPKWACPLAPPENRLDLAIRAGERLA